MKRRSDAQTSPENHSGPFVHSEPYTTGDARQKRGKRADSRIRIKKHGPKDRVVKAMQGPQSMSSSSQILSVYGQMDSHLPSNTMHHGHQFSSIKKRSLRQGRRHSRSRVRSPSGSYSNPIYRLGQEGDSIGPLVIKAVEFIKQTQNREQSQN